MAIPAAWKGACLPVLGEICRVKFPYDHTPGAPGPTAHPGIVLAIQRSKDPFSLFVVYGTSKRLQDAKPWDVVLTKEEANAAGLAHPTRFHLNRAIWLPYDDVWFEKAAGHPSPRMGSLSSAAKLRVSAARVTWELAHQCSLIPGHEPKAPLATMPPPAVEPSEAR